MTPSCLHQVVQARLYDDPIIWDRFTQYANCIRVLVHDTTEATQSHLEQLISELMKRSGGQPFLPLVRTVHRKQFSWHDDHWHSFDLALSSSLEAIKIDVSPNERRDGQERIEGILDDIAVTAPRLQSLEIYAMLQHQSRPQDWLMKSLAKFPRLRSLAFMSNFQLSILHAIATELDLASLHMVLYNPLSDIVTLAGVRIRMANLRKLSIHNGTGLLNPLLEVLELPRLTSLKVHLGSGSKELKNPTREFHIAVAAIIRAVSLEHLRQLHIDIAPGVEGRRSRGRLGMPPPVGFLVLAEFLAPLHALRALEDVDVWLRGGRLQLAAPDAALESAARAWPGLRHFKVTSAEVPSPAPTVAVLAVFARACPSLETLEVPYMDHTVLPPTLDSGFSGTLSVKALKIGSSGVGKYCTDDSVIRRFAEYIRCCFPGLLDASVAYQRDEYVWHRVTQRLMKPSFAEVE